MRETEKIRIPSADLAEFWFASARAQRSILRKIKFGGGHRGGYYRDVRRQIRKAHGELNGRMDLEASADRLVVLSARTQEEKERTRLRGNAELMREYAEQIDRRPFELGVASKGWFMHQNVAVSGAADLVGKVLGKLRVCRFHFSRTRLSVERGEVLCRTLFCCLAPKIQNLRLPAIEVVDVRHGGSISCNSRGNANFEKDLRATLENIEGIWPTLRPPKRKAKNKIELVSS